MIVDGRELVEHRQMARFRHNKAVIIGVLTIAGWILVAITAPVLALSDPIYQHSHGITESGMPMPPSLEFPLGTDSLGRDVLSRLVYGARISLAVGIAAGFESMIIGTALGVLAGYYGAWIDFSLMRITDAMYAIPQALLAIAITAILRPSLGLLVVVIGLVVWAPAARLARGQTLAVQVQQFVEAAHAVGATRMYIIRRHILPHVIPPTLVFVMLQMGQIVLLEAALSYLGAGVQPPTPSWGNMVFEGYQYYRHAPWLVLFPGISLISLAFGFLLLGEGLRDALDPRGRRDYVWQIRTEPQEPGMEDR